MKVSDCCLSTDLKRDSRATTYAVPRELMSANLAMMGLPQATGVLQSVRKDIEDEYRGLITYYALSGLNRADETMTS